MYDEESVLCAASAYTKQFYFNPEYERLPEGVKEELQISCVLFTEDVGGTLILRFDEDGTLLFETAADEGDLLYDDIGAGLKISLLRREKEELFESLEIFYKIFYMDETEDI
ncbi:MAG: DUF6145 family protein [Clostridiales bacterium]|nr:DUF6145 family protein [Clostridiales bacterium]